MQSHDTEFIGSGNVKRRIEWAPPWIKRRIRMGTMTIKFLRKRRRADEGDGRIHDYGCERVGERRSLSEELKTRNLCVNIILTEYNQASLNHFRSFSIPILCLIHSPTSSTSPPPSVNKRLLALRSVMQIWFPVCVYRELEEQQDCLQCGGSSTASHRDPFINSNNPTHVI